MECGEVVAAKRTHRVHRSMAEKRRIVELVLEPRVSVARVAQAEGVNANQVFKWRREYRSGRLVEAEKSTTSLLPVVVSATGFEAGIALSAPIGPEPAASTGAIHIEFPGRAAISVEHGADGSLLRVILESLRQ
ncbi:MAG: putative transposition-related protein [Edaphobacter sp.]|nr:putative transposition-related protein [Edaphobacter sp.]